MSLFIQICPQENLDIISFFPVKNALICPEELWFQAICTSLKLKHSVLILENNLLPFPQWDESKRIIIRDEWCWLAPRSLSLITEINPHLQVPYHQFKSLMFTYKLP
jgi:hypothetical protein